MDVEIREWGKTGRYAVHVDGKRYGGFFDDEKKARELADDVRGRIRPCITCRREIISEGPHHRMCAKCRQLGGW